MKPILFFFVLIVMSMFFSSFKAKDANDYVIEKVQKHDVVIFGEHHWKTDEINFFADMIPKLYKNGVRCFAFEFLCFNVQDLIDSLIYNDQYDIQLQNEILAQFPMFFRKPNENILYELWKLQQEIGIENEKIKVLALTRPITIEWLLVNESDSLERKLAEQFFHTYIKPVPEEYSQMDDNDSLMAKFVLDYYLDTQKKIAIYCGTYHGFTKVYQHEPKEYRGELLKGERIIRLGNILYNELSEKVTNITFMPLSILNTSEEECSTPLDSLLEKQGINRIGFDLNSTFLENYICNDDIVAPRMLPYLSIKKYYDGVIYLKPRKEMKFCFIENEWLTKHLPYYTEGLNLTIKEMEKRFHNVSLCNCWRNEIK